MRLEAFTIAWNAVEAVVAVGVGVAVGSGALVGFGADSGIEVISVVALLWRLLKAGPHASVPEEGAAERKALYLVAATFFLLALFIIYEAAGALLSGEEPETSAVALLLSAVSIIVMPVLAHLKGRTGREMGSRALVADSKETWVCSYLSLALILSRWRLLICVRERWRLQESVRVLLSRSLRAAKPTYRRPRAQWSESTSYGAKQTFGMLEVGFARQCPSRSYLPTGTSGADGRSNGHRRT